MKILLSWLKDYIDPELSTDELVEKLNVTGTEVESVVHTLDELVVVAKIKKVEKHPNADRLQVATVFNGEKDLTIVCGAPNIFVGQIAPLAQIGAKLAGGEIKRTQIRGVESEGMLCASDELGLGDDHSGIIELPKDYVVGKPLNVYISSDCVLELEITPNRGDCLSHIGVAREIAAFTEKSLAKKPIALPMSGKNIKDSLSIEIEDIKLCPQYMARVIEGVKIAPSPEWLQNRLIAIGQKPINNIVDATNYIMFDLGQPLHAFDASKIEGKKIIVRKSKKGEAITSLDGVDRTLNGDIVIADAKKAVAIAGIMGGKNSEVRDETTSIVLESAEFDRKSIRKSKKELGLPSEASYRFERGIDSGLVEYALNKAAALIKEIAGGNILSGIAQAGSRPENKVITIEYEKVCNLTNLDLSKEKINQILKSLGFEVKDGNAIVPLWRHDINIWQDLTEEVARIYGYSKIDPIPVPKTTLPKKSDYYVKEALKDILVKDGFNEAINYPYLSESDAKNSKAKVKDLLEIANPLQPENKYLRHSIVPGLLKSVAKNASFDSVLLFETGKVFSRAGELSRVALISSGKNAKNILSEAINNISEKLKVKESAFTVIELTKDELLSFKVKRPVVFVAEADLDAIVTSIRKALSDGGLKLKTYSKKIHYKPVSKFPALTRDLAFIVDKKVEAETFADTIYEISELISRVELFDEFASDRFGAGKKNIAYHIFLQHQERTMTDSEAEVIVKNIIKSAKTKFNAEIRDK